MTFIPHDTMAARQRALLEILRVSVSDRGIESETVQGITRTFRDTRLVRTRILDELQSEMLEPDSHSWITRIDPGPASPLVNGFFLLTETAATPSASDFAASTTLVADGRVLVPMHTENRFYQVALNYDDIDQVNEEGNPEDFRDSWTEMADLPEVEIDDATHYVYRTDVAQFMTPEAIPIIFQR